MRLSLIFTLLVLALAAGPARAQFEGKPAPGHLRESFELKDFTRIRHNLPGHVEVRHGYKFFVLVEASREDFQQLAPRVEDGRLVLDAKPGHRNLNSVRWYVVMPTLKAVNVHGSGNVTVADEFAPQSIHLAVHGPGHISGRFNAGTLKADVDGEGHISLDGVADRLVLHVDGGGHLQSRMVARVVDMDVDGYGQIAMQGQAGVLQGKVGGSGSFRSAGLATGTARIKVKGAGNVELDVADELDLDMDGEGLVRYTGNPADTHTKISGNARLERL